MNKNTWFGLCLLVVIAMLLISCGTSPGTASTPATSPTATQSNASKTTGVSSTTTTTTKLSTTTTTPAGPLNTSTTTGTSVTPTTTTTTVLSSTSTTMTTTTTTNPPTTSTTTTATPTADTPVPTEAAGPVILTIIGGNKTSKLTLADLKKLPQVTGNTQETGPTLLSVLNSVGVQDFNQITIVGNNESGGSATATVQKAKIDNVILALTDQGKAKLTGGDFANKVIYPFDMYVF